MSYDAAWIDAVESAAAEAAAARDEQLAAVAEYRRATAARRAALEDYCNAGESASAHGRR